MPLHPRSFRGLVDHPNIHTFLQGRQPWHSLPDYWHTGKTLHGLYLTLFDGDLNEHILWEDEQGCVQAYTWLSPAKATFIYQAIEERCWKIQTQPAHRSECFIQTAIDYAEAQLQARPNQQPLKTVAYASDSWFIKQITQRGYLLGACQDVYLQCPLDQTFAEPQLHPDFTIRPFGGLVELEQRAGAQHDAFGGGAEPNEWSRGNIHHLLRHRVDRPLDLELVAVTTAEVIVTFASLAIDPITQLGEFTIVGTRQAYRRQGLAQAILLTGLRYMQQKQMRVAVVRTEADNIAAQRLYQSVGFTIVDRLFSYHKTD